MITSPSWRGERYAVLGLARSGQATVRALLASGAKVVAWDKNDGVREALVDLVQSDSISIEGDLSLEIADPVELDLTGFAGVVVSPGVPLDRKSVV